MSYAAAAPPVIKMSAHRMLGAGDTGAQKDACSLKHERVLKSELVKMGAECTRYTHFQESTGASPDDLILQQICLYHQLRPH